jgi:hypothetical protein
MRGDTIGLGVDDGDGVIGRVRGDIPIVGPPT